MDRLIAPNSVVLANADKAPTSGTPQYATDGNPATNSPATIWPAYQYNAMQEEILAVILAAGITPDKANWTQLLAALRKLGRTKLTANLTLYVATTGSDATGDGSAALPFATIQHAYDTLARLYDLSGFSATIQVEDGTYNQGVYISGGLVGQVDWSSLIIQGNIAAPDNCVLTATVAGALGALIDVGFNGAATIRGFKLSCFGSSPSCIAVGGAGIAVISALDFAASDSTAAHISLSSGGQLNVVGNYTISGGCRAHFYVESSGSFFVLGGSSATITVVGSPAFTTFATTTTNGQVEVQATFVGAAIGQRYSVTLNGVIATNGAGPNFFPGNSAGVIATGGQYV